MLWRSRKQVEKSFLFSPLLSKQGKAFSLFSPILFFLCPNKARKERDKIGFLPTKNFMSRTQWKVSIWEKEEMSMGKLRFGNTTPNISFLLFTFRSLFLFLFLFPITLWFLFFDDGKIEIGIKLECLGVLVSRWRVLACLGVCFGSVLLRLYMVLI